MLKAQLHIHAKGDPEDNFLTHTPKQVIDMAAKLNFDILAFTFHNTLFYNEEIKNYAKSKNILLIPGIEKTIERSHVLILGLEKIPEISKLSELKNLSKKALIVAAHPFYPSFYFYSLDKKCIEHINLFDCIEHVSFYRKRFFNPNKKAIKVAKKYNKPILGTSDVHNINYLEDTHTLIDAKKNVKDVIDAIKKNKIKIISNQISLAKFFYSPTLIIMKALSSGNIRKVFKFLNRK